MKKIIYFFIALVSMTASAQIGIGVATANIDASAQLEVASTTKGFLPPRMTASERDAINTPAAGLVLWCSNCGTKGELQVYNGTEWVNMIGGTVSAVPVAIGDTYGGGIVFYILQSGDPGYDAAKQHGLIAATSDQSSDATWANYSVITDATGDAIGAGKSNTAKIIASNGGGSYAAQLCADYRGGDYTDWYLPSFYEINLLSSHTDIVSGMTYIHNDFFGPRTAYYPYWSSTEIDASKAYYEYFNSQQYTDKLSGNLHVRAIRSF